MLTETTGDLYLTAKQESWAYVGLLGFFAFHLGIILCVLAFEDAIEQHVEVYVQVLGILLIIAGPVLMILSAYLRNKQRKRMRWFINKHNRNANYRQRKRTRRSRKDKKQLSPNVIRDSSKSKVSPSPWFSESSGPLIDTTSRRNIEAWIIQQNQRKGAKTSTPEDMNSSLGYTPPYRLSSLV